MLAEAPTPTDVQQNIWVNGQPTCGQGFRLHSNTLQFWPEGLEGAASLQREGQRLPLHAPPTRPPLEGAAPNCSPLSSERQKKGRTETLQLIEIGNFIPSTRHVSYSFATVLDAIVSAWQEQVFSIHFLLCPAEKTKYLWAESQKRRTCSAAAGNIVTPLSKHTARLSSRAAGAKSQHASLTWAAAMRWKKRTKMRPKSEDAKWKRRVAEAQTCHAWD